MQYGASISQELPGAINLTVGYTGSKGYDMFLRGVGNVLDPVTRVRPVPTYGQIDFKTAGCVDDVDFAGIYPTAAAGAPATMRCRSARRAGSAAGSRAGCSISTRATKAPRRDRTKRARRRTRSTSRASTAPTRRTSRTPSTGRWSYLVPGDGLWTGGWRIGGIVNARSGVPLNVTIARPDNITVNGVTVTNIPGGNSRGTQRPDLVPGVDPYLNSDGVRYLNPAAFATPQPGTFGNLPRNYLRGPSFAQFDLMFSKDFRFAGSPGRCSSASRCSTCSTG